MFSENINMNTLEKEMQIHEYQNNSYILQEVMEEVSPSPIKKESSQTNLQSTLSLTNTLQRNLLSIKQNQVSKNSLQVPHHIEKQKKTITTSRSSSVTRMVDPKQPKEVKVPQLTREALQKLESQAPDNLTVYFQPNY